MTPELATKLLENNQENRPLSSLHVERLTNQIKTGRWKFNGDTVKIAATGDVLDGQHRLWAIIESSRAVETIVVYGIEKDAFSTIDTLRKSRTGGDVLAIAGVKKYRGAVAGALRYLTLYQRGALDSQQTPSNKIENSDIEAAYAAHPGMTRAVEQCMGLRHLVNPAVIACMYYVVSNRNPELADQMISTLRDPTKTSVKDPFFMLRAHFATKQKTWRHTIAGDIALIIKALNAVAKNRPVEKLSWRGQGPKPEMFPKLEV